MEHISVGIADFKVIKGPAILETVGLGSCVCVILYDAITQIGGLAHIMLADSTVSQNKASPNKFADIGIRNMLKKMQEMGALKRRMDAKIIGGAGMFESTMYCDMMTIGEKNVKAVKKILAEEGILLKAEDTGKSHGRTVEFRVETGKVIVKSAKFGVLEL